MRRGSAVGLGLAVALAASAAAVAGPNAGAAAQNYRMTTTLTARAMTKPQPAGNVARARGSLAGKTATAKRQIAWTLKYSGLTSRIKFAEVQYRDATGLTQVILLCAKNCRNGLRITTTFRGPVVWGAFVRQAVAGKAVVVLKTKRNPQGEVRGVLRTRPA